MQKKKKIEQDASYLKLDDALFKTRANLAFFTSDEVSKHDVCLQGTCETWRQLERLIKETAAYYFIGYYIREYQHAGRYTIVNFKANIGSYW